MMDERSERNLRDVHPDLIAVVRRASTMSPLRFFVLEGRRSVQRQIELMQNGKSRIEDPAQGRHVTGHAVDLCVLRDGKAVWDVAVYRQLAAVVLHAASQLSIPVRWGGSYTHFFDGPHFELDRVRYPATPPQEVTHA